MRRRHIVMLASAMIAVSAVSGGIAGLVAAKYGSINLKTTAATAGAPVETTSAQSASGVAGVVARTSPAVVDITTQSQTYSFFGGPMTEEGAGTGMILTSNGYILTNNHVLPVDGGTITVTTSTGTTYTASVVNTNTTADLALIKINASGLATVALSGSRVQVGEPVVAIGNALGQYQNSATEGIISGTNRSVTAGDESSDAGSESLSGLLQTDALINPGDSGGPLVDIATGQVVGMDTAVAESAQGIGFAIPIAQAKAFVEPYISGQSS